MSTIPDPSGPRAEPYAWQFLDEAKAARDRLPETMAISSYKAVERLADQLDTLLAEGKVQRAGAHHFYVDPLTSLQITFQIDPARRSVGVKYVQVATDASQPLVAISYSHKDDKWRNELRTRLEQLQQQKRIRLWDDRAIEAGDEWRQVIEEMLGSADVAILLVSADFLRSEFVQQSELPLLVRRRGEGKLKLLWLPVRPCAFKRQPELEQHQGLLDPGEKTLSEMDKPKRERRLDEIIDQIYDAAVGPA